jgi:hypothetical protein
MVERTCDASASVDISTENIEEGHDPVIARRDRVVVNMGRLLSLATACLRGTSKALHRLGEPGLTYVLGWVTMSQFIRCMAL